MLCFHQLTFVALAFLAPTTEAHYLRRTQGGGPPFDGLPPGLQNRIDSLPPQARAKAIATFEAINFNAAVDADYVEIENNGDVLFVDPPPQGEFPIPDGENSEYPEGAPTQASGVPIYHSKPDATFTLYLDFDGHSFSGHAWASGASIVAKPYSSDGDYTSYSSAELDVIGKSWAIVAEDFAPFDVDVTTEEPPNLDNSVGHVLMTDKVDENGVTIYDCGCGGVAYVNVFGRSDYASTYSPALVFNKVCLQK